MGLVFKFLKSHIVSLLVYLFVMLFVYAAVSKLLNYDTFRNQMGQSTVLSIYAGWLVWFVPAIELLIAIFLTIPRFRLLGLYGFYSLMVLFTAYITIVLNFSPYVPCSCGGVLEALSWEAHLVFNIAFVLLSGILIYLKQSHYLSFKNLVIRLGGVFVVCVGLVILMNFQTHDKMRRNNAFVRSYIPHPVEKVGSYPLDYSTYYIAGITEDSIYLGNYLAPLSLTSIALSLEYSNTYQLGIDSMDLPYRRVVLDIDSPNYYVGDGTVPVLFRGTLAERSASIHSFDDAYFSSYTVIDTMNVGIVTMSSETGTKALGLLSWYSDSVDVTLNTQILEKQHYGLFDTDGRLLWNEKHRQFVYPYTYRNTYEIIDEHLNYITTGTTIDTISQAIVDVVYYEDTHQYKKGGHSVHVNLYSATYGDYLYIHSDRLGKYENSDVLRSASIIDVYNLVDTTYAFSFYLYHQPGKKLRQFGVYNDYIVGLVDNQLWLYRLKPRYFDP